MIDWFGGHKMFNECAFTTEQWRSLSGLGLAVLADAQVGIDGVDVVCPVVGQTSAETVIVVFPSGELCRVKLRGGGRDSGPELALA